MATEEGLQCISAVAGADLSAVANQYKAVKLSANKTVILCAAATDVPVGILQNTPGSGQAATVGVRGVTKWQADAAIAAGVQVGTSADGQADAKVAGTDITEYVIGQVVGGAGAAGEIAEVLISIPGHRAA